MIAKMPIVPISLTCTRREHERDEREDRDHEARRARARVARIAGMCRSSAGMALISRVACQVDVAALDRRSTASVRCSSERDQHDRGGDRGAEADRRVVVDRRLLHDAQTHRREHRRRHALHARDHGRAQRHQQHARIERAGRCRDRRRRCAGYIAMNASSAARPHTTLCSRRTGMPSSDARSAFSALALQRDTGRAEPEEAASAMSTIGTTMITSTSLPSNTAPDTRERRVEERRVLVVVGLAQPHGQEQAERDEQVGDADRHDREDEPGRVEEDAAGTRTRRGRRAGSRRRSRARATGRCSSRPTPRAGTRGSRARRRDRRPRSSRCGSRGRR